MFQRDLLLLQTKKEATDGLRRGEGVPCTNVLEHSAALEGHLICELNFIMKSYSGKAMNRFLKKKYEPVDISFFFCFFFYKQLNSSSLEAAFK